ncbi:hypothetical protein E6R61_17995 [Streptomyces sp. LRa12]|nr:hypothetical protein E6R61_17995 [Streptomyces sp. LRa12]
MAAHGGLGRQRGVEGEGDVVPRRPVRLGGAGLGGGLPRGGPSCGLPSGPAATAAPVVAGVSSRAAQSAATVGAASHGGRPPWTEAGEPNGHHGPGAAPAPHRARDGSRLRRAAGRAAPV